MTSPPPAAADRSTPPPRVLIATFAFNEGAKIRTTVERIVAATAHDVVVMNDGSTDGSMAELRAFPVRILSNDRNDGIGAAMKRAFDHALENGYEALVIMAGNNKDDPSEIPRLLQPIVDDNCDFVQGSRFLQGGGHGNMPLYRRLATRLHPLLFSLATGRWLTESTNGFRAFRTALLRDPRIDWKQEWLNQYELEPYLLYKVITLGYKHTEVPVTKIYPKSQSYTKMRAFTGWWSILRPLVYLRLGLKK